MTDQAPGATPSLDNSPENGLPPQNGGPGGPVADPAPPREIGGREGPDPTRYGDWELKGRCIDF